jgi:peptidoglycan/xylan/chitin deacetylase (PgdA/CDA1 family)
MRGKKSLVSNLLAVTGSARPLIRARALIKSEITILAYHRVLEHWDERQFEFDVELISATAQDFSWQMAYVRDNYSPITFHQLIAHLDGEAPLPPRPILITFDDGFDDNYHHAFPILKNEGVPATFFLSTGYIGGVRTFWYDWLCYLCNFASRDNRPAFTFGGQEFVLSADLPTRRENIAGLFAFVKRLKDDALRTELAKLEEYLEVEYPADGFDASRPMSWQQVREMSDSGIEFGSHAVTHPILTNLTKEKLDQELRLSKEQLEVELARKIEVIAYPVGEDFAFNETVVKAACDAGYRLGASYISGVNDVSKLDHFRLKRLHVERYTSRSDFQGMLAMPNLLA